MRQVCKLVTGIYVMLCLGALAVIPLNAAGMLGEPDSLSGGFAIILAMPWMHLLTNLAGGAAMAQSTALAMAGAGMGLNIALLWYGCRWLATGKLTPD